MEKQDFESLSGIATGLIKFSQLDERNKPEGNVNL